MTIGSRIAGSGDAAIPGTQPEEAQNVRSLAEWVTLVVSIAILAGAFGMVTYLYVAGDGDPITFETEAQLDRIRVSGDIFYVPVTVSNEGDTTATDVQVQADLTIGDEVESSGFSILALSGNDSETGVIAFSRDPREGEFTVRVASYVE